MQSANLCDRGAIDEECQCDTRLHGNVITYVNISMYMHISKKDYLGCVVARTRTLRNGFFWTKKKKTKFKVQGMYKMGMQ